MKLIFKCENNYEGEKFTCIVMSNSDCLPTILEDFENFLRGSGFIFSGNLEIVNLDEKGVE